MANEHRTARVNSGDVSLFYRIFGKPGATPILILHGSNYYDSVDSFSCWDLNFTPGCLVGWWGAVSPPTARW